MEPAELGGDSAQVAGAAQAAILLVGATEQHGPHLGCGMDASIADILCQADSRQTQVLMLPLLPYGCSLEHSRRWPGTIALDPVLMTQLVAGDRCVGASFAR
jgi:creatinine amidohydrolase